MINTTNTWLVIFFNSNFFVYTHALKRYKKTNKMTKKKGKTFKIRVCTKTYGVATLCTNFNKEKN